MNGERTFSDNKRIIFGLGEILGRYFQRPNYLTENFTIFFKAFQSNIPNSMDSFIENRPEAFDPTL